MSVKIVNGVEVFDSVGLSDEIPRTNQHYISASRQINEMLVNGDIYAKKMQGLFDSDSEDESEEHLLESPFAGNRFRQDDSILEDVEKVESIKRHAKETIKARSRSSKGSAGSSKADDNNSSQSSEKISTIVDDKKDS